MWVPYFPSLPPWAPDDCLMLGHETMGSRCVIDGGTDDVHKQQGIVVSSYRHTVPSTGPARLVAAWVINGTLLAAGGTRSHMDTDTDTRVFWDVNSHLWAYVAQACTPLYCVRQSVELMSFWKNRGMRGYMRRDENGREDVGWVYELWLGHHKASCKSHDRQAGRYHCVNHHLE